MPELTRREVDVVAALCKPALCDDAFVAPATAREIAADLVVTEAAVKQHLLRLYQKLKIAEGPNRRVRLANEVVARGLVRPLPAAATGDSQAQAAGSSWPAVPSDAAQMAPPQAVSAHRAPARRPHSGPPHRRHRHRQPRHRRPRHRRPRHKRPRHKQPRHRRPRQSGTGTGGTVTDRQLRHPPGLRPPRAAAPRSEALPEPANELPAGLGHVPWQVIECRVSERRGLELVPEMIRRPEAGHQRRRRGYGGDGDGSQSD